MLGTKRPFCTLTVLVYHDDHNDWMWRYIAPVDGGEANRHSLRIGACLYSYIVGTMCSVVQGLNVTKNEFQNEWTRSMSMEMSYFPTHLRRRIRAYMYYQRDSVGNIEMAEQQLFESVSQAPSSCVHTLNIMCCLKMSAMHRAPGNLFRNSHFF